MDLRHRLLKLKTELGYTTETLSDRSGVPKGTINKLLNGETRNPTAQTLKKLAAALNCPVGDLCGRITEIPAPHPDLQPIRLKKIPLLGEIAAGQPIFCQEALETADCAIGNADFSLRVHGDSMIGARIHDGDIVFIRSQDDVDDGQIAAVIIDDHATLKRVYHVPNGLQLLSENPKYPPMLFTYPDCESIRILGKAVGFASSL